MLLARSNGETPRLRDLLILLRVGQIWTIGAALAALVVGAFLFGGVVEGFSDQVRVIKLSDINSKLRRENDALQSSLTSAQSSLASAQHQAAMVNGKAEFLNRYVQYLANHDALSKKLFVEVVCSLWKESEERVLHPGAPSFSTTIVTGPPFAIVNPSSVANRRPFATVAKPASHREVKTVTFFDGTTYDMPQEIAIAVHADNSCSVRPQ